MISMLAFVTSALLAQRSHGHGWITEPPARNSETGEKNGYCPHCGNGAGICGDGNQWPADSDYLNYFTGTVAEWTAGTIVPVTVKVTAHHKGHFEFSICDQRINSNTPTPQACLDKFILNRASPQEAGLSDCGLNDLRAACQPLDTRHPERFYLPPPGVSPDGSDTHRFYLKIPEGLSCSSCTLQWRWWSANSCIPAPDYGCYYDQLTAAGWNVSKWGLSPGSCPGGGESRDSGCGEEFRNCVDIVVLPLGGTTGSTTMATTQAPTTTTSTAAREECVSQAVLRCINDRSTFWPSCDPAQTKSVAGPNGYEFGFYCTQHWTDTLNEMLSDPAVNKCNDQDAIHKLLAQVAYETGYYSTVYQPLDGGAGLIHMIPGNWPVNAQDMDSVFPGSNYESLVQAMGKDFFQTPEYGWKSVAAWFKRTNGVIAGCGKDLFDETYEEQTRCILSRVVDRQEAFNIVGDCMGSISQTTTMAPTTAPPTSTTTMAPSTSNSQTTTQATTVAETCFAVAGAMALGATNARCAAACGILESGAWPCAGQLCQCSGTTSSTTTMSSTASTTSSVTQVTTTAPVSGCVPNPNLPAQIGTPSARQCEPCATGQTWWPCNPQDGYDLCICSSSLAQAGKRTLRKKVLSP